MDFVAGAATDDQIELRGFELASLSEIRDQATQVGADVVIDLGEGDSLTLQATTIAALHADDFRFV